MRLRGADSERRHLSGAGRISALAHTRALRLCLKLSGRRPCGTPCLIIYRHVSGPPRLSSTVLDLLSQFCAGLFQCAPSTDYTPSRFYALHRPGLGRGPNYVRRARVPSYAGPRTGLVPRNPLLSTSTLGYCVSPLHPSCSQSHSFSRYISSLSLLYLPGLHARVACADSS